MISARLQTCLCDVEQLLAQISSLLISGDAPLLEQASRALRQAMIDLSNATRVEPPRALQNEAVRQRLTQVSQALVRHRENLLRRAVVVDRSLASVLPQAEAATYEAPAPVGGFNRNSAARIYATRAN